MNALKSSSLDGTTAGAVPPDHPLGRGGTDAYWCGRMAEALRGVMRYIATDQHYAAQETARVVVAEYEKAKALAELPADAEFRGLFDGDGPELQPGERWIDGQLWYSSAWINDGVYRYVIFLNEERTRMLTCWPQDDGAWKLDEAVRPDPSATWGPPTPATFRGTIENLEHYALYQRGLTVKELVS